MAKLKPKQTIVDVVDHLDRLNRAYPHLACDVTTQAVVDMRKLFESPPELAPRAAKPAEASPDIQALARKLLNELPLEDAMAALRRQGRPIESPEQMIDIVGNRDYIAALRREAREFQDNALSLDQISSLWNDLRRPALGDDHWTARSISLLLS